MLPSTEDAGQMLVFPCVAIPDTQVIRREVAGRCHRPHGLLRDDVASLVPVSAMAQQHVGFGSDCDGDARHSISVVKEVLFWPRTGVFFRAWIGGILGDQIMVGQGGDAGEYLGGRADWFVLEGANSRHA
jgi:hypothetical protein